MAGWAKLVGMVALSGVVACTATAATGTGWKTYERPAAGMRIAVPASWQDVPLTVTGVQRRIAQLRAKKQYALAAQYGSLIADPYTRKALSTYAFSAFAWPAPPGPITTDVGVRVRQVGKPLLRHLTHSIADGLRGQGTTLDPVRFVRLPAGEAGLIRGVQELDPSYGGAKTAFSLYLLLHAGRLFSIEFRTDSRFEPRQRIVFAAIARRFGYL